STRAAAVRRKAGAVEGGGSRARRSRPLEAEGDGAACVDGLWARVGDLAAQELSSGLESGQSSRGSRHIQPSKEPLSARDCQYIGVDCTRRDRHRAAQVHRRSYSPAVAVGASPPAIGCWIARITANPAREGAEPALLGQCEPERESKEDVGLHVFFSF